jgi:hypothetical protein
MLAVVISLIWQCGVSAFMIGEVIISLANLLIDRNPFAFGKTVRDG